MRFHCNSFLYSHSTENGTECVPCILTDRPDPAEFRRFLKYFLAANPNATCASGGHAAFGDAVILANDNESVISKSHD